SSASTAISTALAHFASSPSIDDNSIFHPCGMNTPNVGFCAMVRSFHATGRYMPGTSLQKPASTARFCKEAAQLGEREVTGLDVVAVGVAHEAAVVAGGVPPLLRLVQHLCASRASHLDERVDLLPRGRREGDVHVVVGPARRHDGPDEEQRAAHLVAEADVLVFDDEPPSTERFEHRLVERPAGNRVGALNR